MHELHQGGKCLHMSLQIKKRDLQEVQPVKGLSIPHLVPTPVSTNPLN